MEDFECYVKVLLEIRRIENKNIVVLEKDEVILFFVLFFIIIKIEMN